MDIVATKEEAIDALFIVFDDYDPTDTADYIIISNLYDDFAQALNQVKANGNR